MNDLDNKFKQGLEDYTSLPSPAMWENIEAALDAEQGKNATRVVPMWGWASTAVASIALALLLLPFSSPTPYNPRTEPTQTEEISAPSPNLVDFYELAVEEPTPIVRPKNNASEAPPAKRRKLSPAWENAIEEEELELAVEADFLPFDRVQAEWIQEPVKVIIDFKDAQVTDNLAEVSTPNESTLLVKTTGAAARLIGVNIARLVGQGTVNWEVAKSRYNSMAIVNKSTTPKNNNK